jgi:hypothetical protein
MELEVWHFALLKGRLFSGFLNPYHAELYTLDITSILNCFEEISQNHFYPIFNNETLIEIIGVGLF